jgi:hypothetical protein
MWSFELMYSVFHTSLHTCLFLCVWRTFWLKVAFISLCYECQTCPCDLLTHGTWVEISSICLRRNRLMETFYFYHEKNMALVAASSLAWIPDWTHMKHTWPKPASLWVFEWMLTVGLSLGLVCYAVMINWYCIVLRYGLGIYILPKVMHKNRTCESVQYTKVTPLSKESPEVYLWKTHTASWLSRKIIFSLKKFPNILSYTLTKRLLFQPLLTRFPSYPLTHILLYASIRALNPISSTGLLLQPSSISPFYVCYWTCHQHCTVRSNFKIILRVSFLYQAKLTFPQGRSCLHSFIFPEISNRKRFCQGFHGFLKTHPEKVE